MLKAKTAIKRTDDGFEYTAERLPDGTDAMKVTKFQYQNNDYSVETVLAYERIPCDSTGHSPGKVGIYGASDSSGKELYVTIINGRTSEDPRFAIVETGKTLPEVGMKLLGSDNLSTLAAVVGVLRSMPGLTNSIVEYAESIKKK